MSVQSSILLWQLTPHGVVWVNVFNESFFPWKQVWDKCVFNGFFTAKTLRYLLAQKTKINLHWDIFTGRKKVTTNPILPFMHLYSAGNIYNIFKIFFFSSMLPIIDEKSHTKYTCQIHTPLTDEWHWTKI